MKILEERLLNKLIKNFEGEIFTDKLMRNIYATDASAYKELPLAVCYPKNTKDIQSLILFATENKIPLIPRAAGTSLAGQVVGNGIVVDISKSFSKILEVNTDENWVRVEPGVILEELNNYLKPYNLFFGPETSTANRCMMAGMLANNSCGSHSLIYGSTRDHTVSVKCILSNGKEVEFGELNSTEFKNKLNLEDLEGAVYKNIYEILSDKSNQEEIIKQYPDPSVKRRNTGYALDLLLDSEPFLNEKKGFNFSNLIAGSEGTLAFITEIKLNLVPSPPKEIGVMAAHFNSKEEAFKANLIALEFNPGAVEMMDSIILGCTKDNIEQKKNRFFIQGDPEAILIIEFARDTMEEINTICKNLENRFKENNFGYHFPLVFGNETKKVWNLRKAGLGVLSNLKGDAKPVSVIEDTAVSPKVLPDYMKDFQKILDHYQLDCVYHAHIGTGELHLRPVLDLKNARDVELFHTLGKEIAHLVKKYKGSLSGEHGDGRLRGEFIPIMIGEQNYKLLKSIKETWDPNHIFNPGKITETPPMNQSLRYDPNHKTPEISTIFNFDGVGGYLRAIEKCNGSGDCRKSAQIGGTMCPTYMATNDEDKTTRARANALRQYISEAVPEKIFDQKDVKDILDLCISCKGCKSECPSSVDMAKLKAEYMQHYYDIHGIPFRSRLVAYISKLNAVAVIAPGIANFFIKNKISSKIIMKSIGFEPKRNMPTYYKTTLSKWYKKNNKANSKLNKTVYLFNDEFSNYNDTEIGIKAFELLNKLGYEVIIPKHLESGRTYLSKGLVRTAKKIANKNIEYLKDLVNEKTPLIGIEPSAILSFRDEYLDLAEQQNQLESKELAANTFLFEEFIAREIDAGNIKKEQFTTSEQHIKLHGHCQQKAVASTEMSKKVLSFPENYTVEEIPSGCCGMAGSFGYEKEHYELSMKIGEMVLFPAVRNAKENDLIAAPGTSCRHQIKDGTKKTAYHPIEILWNALLK